jgi:hypothetical protein
MPAIVFISLFIGLILLVNYLNNISRRKNYEIVMKALAGEVITHLENVRSETSSIGVKGRGYYFSRCELVITEDALIIFGWGRIKGFKQLTAPLILTSNPTYFDNFPFAKPIWPTSLALNSFGGNVCISYTQPGFIDTDVEFVFKGITDEVKAQLLFINDLKINQLQA